MGAVLSKIQDTKIDNLIKIWLKSTYFRVAIAMITFLIARRIYNKCHRIYYDLPISGPTGIPLIGCIPSLLLNTYKFMEDMTKYGDVTTYNLGLQSITLINNTEIAKKLCQQNPNQTLTISSSIHDNVEILDKWQQRRKFVQQIITKELNSKFLTKCIKTYIMENIHFHCNSSENDEKSPSNEASER